MTNTAELIEALTQKQRPIWLFVLSACALATLWALAASFDSLKAMPPSLSDPVAVANRCAELLGQVLVPSIIVWGVFNGFFFSRRATLGKSFAALGIMVTVAFSAATMLHFRLVTPGYNASAVRWTMETRSRFDQHFEGLGASTSPDALRAAFAPTRQEEIESRLAEVRRLKSNVEAYVRTLAADEIAARDALAKLNIDDETRADRLGSGLISSGPQPR